MIGLASPDEMKGVLLIELAKPRLQRVKAPVMLGIKDYDLR